MRKQGGWATNKASTGPPFPLPLPLPLSLSPLLQFSAPLAWANSLARSPSATPQLYIAVARAARCLGGRRTVEAAAVPSEAEAEAEAGAGEGRGCASAAVGPPGC